MHPKTLSTPLRERHDAFLQCVALLIRYHINPSLGLVVIGVWKYTFVLVVDHEIHADRCPFWDGIVVLPFLVCQYFITGDAPAARGDAIRETLSLLYDAIVIALLELAPFQVLRVRISKFGCQASQLFEMSQQIVGNDRKRHLFHPSC